MRVCLLFQWSCLSLTPIISTYKCRFVLRNLVSQEVKCNLSLLSTSLHSIQDMRCVRRLIKGQVIDCLSRPPVHWTGRLAFQQTLSPRNSLSIMAHFLLQPGTYDAGQWSLNVEQDLHQWSIRGLERLVTVAYLH